MRRGVVTTVDGSKFSLTVTFPKSHGNMTSILRILQSFQDSPASLTVNGATAEISVRHLGEWQATNCVTRLSQALIPGLEQCSTELRITLSGDRTGRKDGIGSQSSTPRSGRG